jgi:hypothetical protein
MYFMDFKDFMYFMDLIKFVIDEYWSIIKIDKIYTLNHIQNLLFILVLVWVAVRFILFILYLDDKINFPHIPYSVTVIW